MFSYAAVFKYSPRRPQMFTKTLFHTTSTHLSLRISVTKKKRLLICKICLKVAKEKKVFGFVGADHLRTKIIVNDETLEQVIQ